MSPKNLSRKMRMLVPVSAVALTAVLGITAVQQNSHHANMHAYRLTDGSETTNKPPKPHHRPEVADGSETTNKPPKPHLHQEIADGSETTNKPPKPKKVA